MATATVTIIASNPGDIFTRAWNIYTTFPGTKILTSNRQQGSSLVVTLATGTYYFNVSQLSPTVPSIGTYSGTINDVPFSGVDDTHAIQFTLGAETPPPPPPIVYGSSESTQKAISAVATANATTLTLSIPTIVGVGVAFAAAGSLKRTDNSVGVASQTVGFYLDGASTAFDLVATDSAGNYSKSLTLNIQGTHTIIAKFSGAALYLGSASFDSGITLTEAPINWLPYALGGAGIIAAVAIAYKMYKKKKKRK